MSKTNILKSDAPKLQSRSNNKFTAFLLDHIYVICTFVASFFLMTLAFGLMNVSPFGTADKQIMVVDNWHQYYPFLADFQYKLQHGESLFWNWSVGAGVNNFALMSYYLASPLNFLTVFLPPEWLREFLMFSVVLKISLGGTFTAYFLRKVYNRNDISLLLFGVSFSFCAFFMGYYWNNIWLDTVCITPLVALGVYSLLKDGNFRLYTVTLTLSLLANYYIGFFTCIFVLLIFIVYHIIRWEGIKKLFFNLIRIGGFTLIAIGMTAFFLLPAYFGLQNTNSSGSSFPSDFAINMGGSNDLIGVLRALKYIVANLVNFSCAATKAADAIPNIACGAISVFFGLLFFTTKKISLKEKLVDFGLLLFMFLSCIIRWLDYMWHGFHFTNMIPYRFSYLISFVIIIMAFRAYMVIDSISLLNVISASLLSALVLTMAIGDKGYDITFKDHLDWMTPTIIGSAIMLFLVAAMVALFSKRIISKRAMSAVLVVIVLAQSGMSAFYGVTVTTVTGTYDYPRGEGNTVAVIEEMNRLEENSPELWRAEMTSTQTLNDGALNHYRGISAFNSMANVDMSRFCENFGMMGWKGGNRYTYAEGSPVTNTFMNLKYLISRDNTFMNSYDFDETYTVNGVKLLKNKHYIPMGFMIDRWISMWEENDNEDQFNPFDKQNEFFRYATAIKDDVYEPLEVVSQGHSEANQITVTKNGYGDYYVNCVDQTTANHVKWNYTAPQDGEYFMYADIANGDDVTVMQNDVAQTKKYGMGRSYIAAIGHFSKGDKISVYADLEAGKSGSAKVYVNRLKTDIFEQGLEKISKDVMTTTSYSGNSVEGNITVSEEGMFYTSIPYEEGWTATVDGEETKITPIGGSLLAFPLQPGEHTIKLVYYPQGFWIGLAVSIVALAAFIAACVFFCVIKKKKKATASAEAEKTTDK